MFRTHDCLEGHIIIGLLFSLAGVILLTIVTFSTPFTRSIYFLSASDVKFGSFGYCTPTGCTPRSVGYVYGSGDEIRFWLTQTHILFGIAALLMLIAYCALFVYLMTCEMCTRNHLTFRTPAFFGSTLAILATVFALVNWVTAHNRFSNEGVEVNYGVALWLAIAGSACSALSFCLGGPAFGGRIMYRTHRDEPYLL